MAAKKQLPRYRYTFYLYLLIFLVGLTLIGLSLANMNSSSEYIRGLSMGLGIAGVIIGLAPIRSMVLK